MLHEHGPNWNIDSELARNYEERIKGSVCGLPGPVTEPTFFVDGEAAKEFCTVLFNELNVCRDGTIVRLSYHVKSGSLAVASSLTSNTRIAVSSYEYEVVPGRYKRVLHLGHADAVDSKYRFIRTPSDSEVARLIWDSKPEAVITDGSYNFGDNTCLPGTHEYSIDKFISYVRAIQTVCNCPNFIRVSVPDAHNAARRHGASTGLTMEEIAYVKSKLPGQRLGVNVYFGNPIRNEDMVPLGQTFQQALKMKIRDVQVGGFGGHGEKLPLFSLKKVLSAFPNMNFTIELGTALTERCSAFVCPPDWNTQKIKDYIPDAKEHNLFPISYYSANGRIVVYPVAYLYKQLIASGKRAPVKTLR